MVGVASPLKGAIGGAGQDPWEMGIDDSVNVETKMKKVSLFPILSFLLKLL